MHGVEHSAQPTLLTDGTLMKSRYANTRRLARCRIAAKYQPGIWPRLVKKTTCYLSPWRSIPCRYSEEGSHNCRSYAEQHRPDKDRHRYRVCHRTKHKRQGEESGTAQFGNCPHRRRLLPRPEHLPPVRVDHECESRHTDNGGGERQEVHGSVRHALAYPYLSLPFW